MLSVGVGLLIVAIGIVGLPAPGPGFLIIALGGAFLARESHAVARAMDWLEVRLRRVLHWARSAWKHAAPLARRCWSLWVWVLPEWPGTSPTCSSSPDLCDEHLIQSVTAEHADYTEPENLGCTNGH